MTVRPAAVAGTFYESDAARLRAHIDTLLANAPAPPGQRPQALIVPHAGYVYSGATAASAYRTLSTAARDIRRVVMFGPAHRVPLRGMALPDTESFRTPLGDISLDQDFMDKARTLTGVTVSGEAHRLEHSLEVQLPFLQAVLGEFTLLPIVVGLCDADTVGAAMDALWGGPETLVVVSTDLSHFHDYEEACRIDRATCARILRKDTALHGEEACGAYALNGLMRSEHGRALVIKQLQRCNSGDTAGDKRRVVGYGAFLLY